MTRRDLIGGLVAVLVLLGFLAIIVFAVSGHGPAHQCGVPC